ncbi:GatB/YqeY domain-containing protein [Candidatus Pelagibacter bacterium]|nr:GatB/YqeY domain-containing protein [Candidatus Pelagibacter bacterium]
MPLKKQIEDKLNEALKAKDKNTYPTLRLIVSAIKDAEIAGRSKGQKEIKDADITSILKKMIKQRNESCEVYKKAGRSELLENETKEINVISGFLPKQMSEAEMKKVCEEAIKTVGASSMKDMGKVMGELKSNHADTLDFSKVSGIIKGLLN